MDTNCSRTDPLELVLTYYYLSWIFNCMKESHVFILNPKTYSQYLKLKICLNLIGNIKAIFHLHGLSFPLKHLVKFISDKKALPKSSFLVKKKLFVRVSALSVGLCRLFRNNLIHASMKFEVHLFFKHSFWIFNIFMECPEILTCAGTLKEKRK